MECCGEGQLGFDLPKEVQNILVNFRFQSNTTSLGLLLARCLIELAFYTSLYKLGNLCFPPMLIVSPLYRRYSSLFSFVAG
jgi:hypothetical protein